MALILFLQASIAIGLILYAMSRGFEAVLPAAAFFLLLLPNEAQLQLAGMFDLTTQRVTVLILLVLWVSIGKKKQHAEMLPLRWMIALVIGWMLLSSANSVVPTISFKTTLSQAFDYFAVYVIFATSITQVGTLKRILFAFVCAMMACSVIGYIEAYTGWSVISIFPELPSRFSDLGGGSNDRGLRVQSTFGHAILFGATLAMVIPMAMYLLSQAKAGGRRMFLWVALLLMIACIYKTSSRGPWIALGISFAVLLLLGHQSIRRYLTVMALLTIMVLVARPGVGASISSMYEATRDPTSPEGQSYQWRYMLYHLAGQELGKSTERALWGYGPESFFYLGLTAPFMVDGQTRTVKVLSCDSAVVEILIDTGYVGFLLVALILVKAGLTARRVYADGGPDAKGLALAMALAVGAFSFMMTNVEIYGWGQQNYMLWILVAMIMVSPRLVKTLKTQTVEAVAADAAASDAPERKSLEERIAAYGSAHTWTLRK